jgi:ABC-2 type transport system permease protein
MTVLLITVFAGLALNTDISRGTLDRFRTLPIWRPAPIVGGLLGDAGLVLVFSFGLSWIWTTLGLVLRTPTSVSMVSFLVQFPLTLASNIFVDPETIPGWLRAFVEVNPVSLLVTVLRDLITAPPPRARSVGCSWPQPR